LLKAAQGMLGAACGT